MSSGSTDDTSVEEDSEEEEEEEGSDDESLEVEALQRKVRWYANTQDLITKNDERLLQQEHTIQTLRQRIEDLEDALARAQAVATPDAPAGRGRGRGTTPKGLELALRKRIRELEDMLTAKTPPDSIPALIRAARPTDQEANEQRALKRKVQQLQKALDDETARFQKELLLMHQETDAQRIAFEKRMELAGEEFKGRLQQVVAVKQKEAQKTLDKTREFYIKKVRTVEQQCSQLKVDARNQRTTPAGSAAQQHPIPLRMVTPGKNVETQTDPPLPQRHANQGTSTDPILIPEVRVMPPPVAAVPSGHLEALLKTLPLHPAAIDGQRRVAYLEAVAERLQSLEHHFMLREAEMRRELETAKRMANFELSVEKQQLELVVQQKNNEIASFRRELDGLLSQLADVRRSC